MLMLPPSRFAPQGPIARMNISFNQTYTSMRPLVQKLLAVWVITVCTAFTLYSQNDLSLDVTTSSAGTEAVGNTGITYTVTVNNEGATTVNGVEVTVNLPAGVSLTGSTPGAGSYTPGTGVWDIGTIASTTSSVTLTLTVDATGEGVQAATANITAMTEFDGDSDPTDDSVYEDDYGTACFTVPFEYCAGTTPNITATAPAGYSNYQWFKDGVAISGATAQTYNITEFGDFSYTTDVGGTGGCAGGNCCDIVVNQLTLPTASIDTLPATAVIDCNTTSIALTANGGASYSWSTTETTQSINVTSAGTYTVTVTAANGCTATEAVTITEDITPPTAGITDDSATDTLTCNDPSIDLTASGGGTYSWSTGATTAGITVTTPGTYTVTVTGANGCTATASQDIFEDVTPPTAGITDDSATDTLTCNDPDIALTATGGGTYAWSTGATTTGITVTTPGTYTVTVTAANGCTATASLDIFEDTTPPTAGITNNDGTTEITCVQTSISVTATGGGTYLWDNGLGVAATQSLTSAGTYRVTVTAANGCTAVDSVIITGGCTVDYGDLPDATAGTGPGDYQTTSANGGPSHGIITGLSLGTTIDAEADGNPSANADGDDTTGSDDDDGVIVGPTYDIVPDGTIRVPITVTNTTGNTAYLTAYIDWNGDGDFNDPGEEVISLNDGTTPFPSYLEISVPSDAQEGTDIGFIVRVSNSPITSPDGYLSSGEVESYLIDVNCPAQICLPVTSTKN